MIAKKFIGMFGVAVTLPKEMKEKQFGWTVCHKKTFDVQQVVVVNVIQNDRDTVYITYFSQGKTSSFVAPNDFKMAKIRGKRADALVEEYRKFMIKNLRPHLGHGSLTVGSDPEIFVENKKDGIVIPAFDFLGSKREPTIGPASTGGCKGNKPIYWDGFQAEFVTDAATCLAWQVDSVQLGLKGVLEAARKHCKDAVLSTKVTMDIPHEMLENSKQEHVEFGCMPSFNAYNMKGIGGDGRNVPFRSAGGHIHFGLKKFTEKDATPIVKALDMILGVACVSLFAKFDNPKRRTMYGLAGEFRLPEHGIEYRVLSNAWIYHPLIMNVVFDLARKVFILGQKGLHKYWVSTEEETIQVINSCDVDGARDILKRNEDMFLSLLDCCYGDRDDSKIIMKMFLEGMESVVETPHDLEKNWDLSGKWITHSDGHGKNWRYSRDTLNKKRKVA